MIILISWWLAILWTFSDTVPRPFDDWKNGLLYIGAGIFVIASAAWQSREIATPGQPGSQQAGDRHGLRPRDDVTLLIIIATYFSLALLSILFSPTGRYEGVLELARLLVWAGLAWGFAQLSSRTWLWIFRVTVISAAVIAALTWFQSHGTTIWPYDGNFLAPIGHITYYGDFMALSLVMAMGLWGYCVIARSVATRQSSLHQRDRHGLWPRDDIQMEFLLWPVCMLFIDLGLALSATRASLVGLIVALVLAILLVGIAMRSPKRVGIVAIIGILNLVVIFAFPIRSLRGASASARLEQTTSISRATIDAVSSGRWHTYVTSAHIALERPALGWGLGTFRFVYPEFASRNAADSLVSSSVWYMHPHNEVLHQAVELGFPGAFLFILGFLYLLYRRAGALHEIAAAPSGPRNDKRMDPNIFLITAMCGLTAAFISWQFSTNFLFPVSRLMTALFGGIILHLCHRERSAAIQSAHTGLLRGLRPLAMTTVALSTLILLAYQISLMCVQKEQTSRSATVQWDYATWSVRLAPGAFDPLFIRAAVALTTQPPAIAESDVTSLYDSYPYVPAALHMMGVLRAREERFSDARNFLEHALANDPNNAGIKQLLDRLPVAH